MDRKEWRWIVWVALGLVVVSSLPYLVAWGVTPESAHFTGLIFNPQDGNSYIAKMRQGFAGSWSFRLPYTPEPHDGAPVYLFYLFWGHVARWTGRIGLGAGIVTTKTLRRRLFGLPGRLTRSARRMTLHLPRHWPWAEAFARALSRLRAIPIAA